MNKEVPLNTLVIPRNFGDTGRCMNGQFRTRNLIEALVMALPPFWAFLQSSMSIDTKIVWICFVCGPLFGFGIVGIAGDSITEYLINICHFLHSKRVSKYNPRIKLEATPGYLTKEMSELPRDKIMRFAASISKQLSESEEAISADIYDPAYSEFFADDVGIIEKPDDLKSKRELRMEKRERKYIQKIRKKARKKTIHDLKAVAAAKNVPFDINDYQAEIKLAEDDAEEEYRESKKTRR